MAPRLRAALVGAGRIGAGYADDPVTARHFPFATHAQVLAAHPAIDWTWVVDASDEARAAAAARWGIPRSANDVRGIGPDEVDLVVVATPPADRLALVRSLPPVKAILLEKPIALDLAEARALVDHCGERGILLQVALWRRGDPALRRLAEGGCRAAIGRPLGGFGIYGNGIRNNGTHMIDLVRMLVGEIEAAQTLGPARACAGPLPGDVDVPFALSIRGAAVVSFLPVPFDRYRENSLDLWGDAGRLEILQEGLRLVHHPVRGHRAMSDAREIASDATSELESGAHEALFRLYDNLVAAVLDGEALWSPGGSALRAEVVVHALLASAAATPTPIP